MDTLTHALSGALLARATVPRRQRPDEPGLYGRMGAGFVAGAFPDSDFALRAVDTLWYLSEVHQGATHSLVLLPLWALLIAGVFGRLSGLRWQGYLSPAALGLAIHVAGDLITAYGTMVFFPFSDWRPALSFAYVLDPYFTGILVAGLWAAWRWPAHGRSAAVVALLALAGYIAFLGVQHQRALAVGDALARAERLAGARSHAVPQPLSPGHWKVIVSHDEAYRVAWLRLLPGRGLLETIAPVPLLTRMSAQYRPDPPWRERTRFGSDPAEVALAREAWQQQGFADFRRFARFPVLHEVTIADGRECAWFMDLRFALPELPPSFVFGMCRASQDSPWQRARRRGAFWID